MESALCGFGDSLNAAVASSRRNSKRYRLLLNYLFTSAAVYVMKYLRRCAPIVINFNFCGQQRARALGAARQHIFIKNLAQFTFLLNNRLYPDFILTFAAPRFFLARLQLCSNGAACLEIMLTGNRIFQSLVFSDIVFAPGCLTVIYGRHRELI